jgi:pyruvate dehydrogenase E2 component (dihydrolipoamide acetyltransferase)
MAIKIVMPRLGWTMEEGVLAEWIKHDGDEVRVGDILFTVESDKALQEIESLDSGILRIPPESPPLGSTVKVGGLLAYLVQPAEALPWEATSATSTTEAPMVKVANVTPITQVNTAVSMRSPIGELPAVSPRARRVASELGVDWTMLKGSGHTGRIVEKDVRAAAANRSAASIPAPQGAAQASPIAQRVARDLGVDLGSVVAQIPGERVTREDVERYASRQPAAAPSTLPGIETRTPVSSVRRVIAERMSASAHTTAPVTLTTEVDATELVHLRQQLKDLTGVDPRPVPSYNDLFIKLLAHALTEHPALNTRLEGDQIVMSSAVHIGVAVDTERGLLVPVIHDVQAKTIRQIAGDSAALAEKARTGTLAPDDLHGGTFTMTNLGMYEIDAFTPIINLPECAILGVGRVVPKQVVIDAETEKVAIRQMMFLSLTFDHRLVDGAPAARFLQRLKQLVEKPYLWLVG